MTKAPGNVLFTPEQVAERLGLHVKTVRRYIQEGQLETVRVGKRRRVTRAGLEAFAGIDLEEKNASTTSGPDAEVSSVVSIDDVTEAIANNITKYMLASAKSRGKDDRPFRVDTVYDTGRRRLKIILSGSLASTTVMLALINALIQGDKNKTR